VLTPQDGLAIAMPRVSSGGNYMQDFKKLTAWQKSHGVTLQMYAD